MKHGGYRWRSENPRSERVEMRLTTEEKRMLEKAAQHAGVDMATAARACTLDWARRTMAEKGKGK